MSAGSAAFLPDVYTLTNQIYQATGWHTSEQNAFGLLLQTRTKTISASPYIQHYWSVYSKLAMDDILAKKLTSAVTQLPLAERIILAKQWTIGMPIAVQEYFAQHRTLQLQIEAVQSFIDCRILQAYKQALVAFLSAPGDVKFIKDILYHTKRLLLK